MLNKIKSGVAAVALVVPSMALAGDNYECGFQPLPPGVTLHYVIYNATHDVGASYEVLDVYNHLTQEYSNFFSQHRPRISFIEHPEDIALFTDGDGTMISYNVTIVIGDEQSALDVRSRSIANANTVTIVPSKERIDPTTILDIESLSDTTYYRIASNHAIRLGTYSLAVNPHELATITTDHILASY